MHTCFTMSSHLNELLAAFQDPKVVDLRAIVQEQIMAAVETVDMAIYMCLDNNKDLHKEQEFWLLKQDRVMVSNSFSSYSFRTNNSQSILHSMITAGLEVNTTPSISVESQA